MTSFEFLIYIFTFLPAVLLCYHLAGENRRWIVLLCASYIFYVLNSGKLTVFLLLSTLTVYFAGLWIGRIQEKCDILLSSVEKEQKKKTRKIFDRRKKWVVALTLAVNFGIILHLKYSFFFKTAANSLLESFGTDFRMNPGKYALPLGISFYTMSAASYIMDVCRGTVPPEKNIGKIALYLAFFPQIMEGPICRYSDTAGQLFSGKDIEYKNLTFGLQRIAFGTAKRMLVADRVNNFVGWVHTFHYNYDGGVIALATVCYSFQIYMDFSGTMDIVLGMAEIFGIRLPENFRRPFFSRTISEFWTRWHITLGKWFSDYIFYPVSMSKPMKKLAKYMRKKLGNYYGPLIPGTVALLLVWICNGLWHGAGWQYLFFGLYHCTIIMIGNFTSPLWRTLAEKLHIDREHTAYKIFQMIRTALLFNFGELFFRAEDLKTGFSMLKSIFTDFTLASIKDGTVFKLWLDPKDMAVLMICFIALLIHGIRAERGHDVREEIAALRPGWRYAIFASLIMITLIFGGYGFGYSYVEPIYANF